MKKVRTKLLCYVIAGVVVNFAVAWGCSLWAPRQERASALGVPSDLSPLVPQGWLSPASKPDRVMVVHRTYGGAGFSVRRIEFHDLFLGAHTIVPNRVLHCQLTGWPLRAFYCVGELDQSMNPNRQKPSAPPRWHGAFAAPVAIVFGRDPSVFYSYAPLPWSPRPLGFAINTIMYSLGSWFLYSIVARLGRWRISAPASCPRCAYSLIGLPSGAICPECGEGESV